MFEVSELGGGVHWLLRGELAVLTIAALGCLIKAVVEYRSCRPPDSCNWRIVSFVLFFLIGLVFFVNQLSDIGRPIAGLSLVLPGSPLARMLIIDIPGWLRRALEPTLWIFAFGLCFCAVCSRTRVAQRGFLSSVVFLLVAISVEVFSLMPGIRLRMWGEKWFEAIAFSQFFLTQSVIFASTAALLAELFDRGNTLTYPLRRRARLCCFVFAAAALGFAAALMSFRGVAGEEERLLVGAHYYSWFPDNWNGGYLAEKLVPPVTPWLGRYSSMDEKVFSQHVAWASGAGIDFFVFDWWPRRPGIGRSIYSHVKRKGRLGSMRFSLMYESLDLREPGDTHLSGEAEHILVMTPERAWRLKKHWEYLALHYMGRDEYLKIDGKAVLFVYATRHLLGPVADAVKEARKHVRAKTGIELFLVADEVFFNVLTYSPSSGVRLRPDFSPEWGRISAFDALTAYNPYDPSRPEHGGLPGVPTFLDDVEELYRYYRSVCAALGISFFPGVLSGYNDRGVRLSTDHFVIPRFLDAQASGTFFGQSLRRWGLSQTEQRNPLISITSWNEWNEGTQIEPTRYSPLTVKDLSESGKDFTQGEVYQGYALSYLHELARVLAAFRESQGKKK